MADNDILLKLKLLDEYSAELKKFGAELKKTEGDATKSTGKISTGFGDIKSAIAEGSKVAAFTALVAGLKNVMAAARAAEQSNAKLAASLKATGQYTDGAMASLKDWSVAMMRAKGVDDELAKSLVADAVAKGKNIEQSKRLTEAAANMAPVVGSVEAAMGLLVRASNGSTEALKRYGIQVTEAEAASGDFESVLQRVEKQFAGQAAAQVATYAGQIKVLAGEFENFKEVIGTPLIAAATDWLTMLNQLIAKHGELERAMSSVNENASYMNLARQLSTLNDEADRLNKLMAREGKWGSFDIDFAQVRSELDSVNQQIDKVLAKMGETTGKAKASGVSVSEASAGTSSAAKFTATKSSSATKRKVTFYGVNSKGETEVEEGLRKDAEEAAAKITLTTRAELKRAAAAYQEKLQDEMQERLTGGEMFGPTRETLASDIATETEAFFSDIDTLLEDQRAAVDLQITLANLEMKWADVERENEEKAHQARLEAEQVAYENATTYIGFANQAVQLLASKDYLGAIRSALGTFGGAKGKVASEIIGLFQTVVSLFNQEAKTEGNQARKALNEALEEWYDEVSVVTAILGGSFKKGALTDLELDATGRADFWSDLAEQITGSDGGGQANILAAQFEGLGLTTGQLVDSLGNLIASANGLTEAEGDQLAAQTALLSLTTFTREELSAYAQAYGDATNLIERRSELEEQILEQAQAYADATGSAKDKALTDLEASRAEYVGLLVKEAENAKAADQALVDALTNQGMSEEEAKELVNSQKSATEIAASQLTVLESIAASLGASVPEHHTGSEHLAMVRNDELIAPPEKFREAADYLSSRGYSSSDSSSRTIVLQLDGKTVAKVVDGHSRAMKRTGEVAA